MERIVLIALPVADALARRYRFRGIEDDDLEQVARTALVRAATRYRPGQGHGFIAFAAPSITGELKRWFRDHGWAVRPPRRLQELRPLLAGEEEHLRHSLLREPLDSELARALDITEDDVTEARVCAAGYQAASLDAPNAAGTSLADRALVAPSVCEWIETREALRWAVERLDRRQRLVLRLRFVDDLTQAEIGLRIGVSQMQVSRILRTVMTSLRSALAQEDLQHPVA
ncbi:RNA polymerase sigma factor [Knoellia aerolata DSM 18566]|uniref:RNA polymerase sigma factor n=1 Tax=Knoellia aerolata DSM 18566 TaxID=1385519 RepID=A0A0A0JZB7_9MICO|nr:RNA polymerase sigma factor [Knoellia aerolata DSM 18566]